jgi:hypothetical protein
VTARAELVGQHWELFEAWCHAEDVLVLPASTETVAAFLEAFPGSKSQQRRPRQAIAIAHERVGEPP